MDVEKQFPFSWLPLKIVVVATVELRLEWNSRDFWKSENIIISPIFWSFMQTQNKEEICKWEKIKSSKLTNQPNTSINLQALIK